MADWLAMRKGEYLGVMDADEAAERAAKEKTDDLPTRTVEIMVSIDSGNSHSAKLYRFCPYTSILGWNRGGVPFATNGFHGRRLTIPRCGRYFLFRAGQRSTGTRKKYACFGQHVQDDQSLQGR